MRKSKFQYKYVVFIMVCVGFLGCTKEPALKVYSLEVPFIQKLQSSQHRHQSIKVTYPNSIKEPMSDKMYFSYSVSDKGSYQNAQWSNNINKLLQGTFIETIDNTHMFKTILSDTSSVEENLRLESDVYTFEHKVRGADSYAAISIQFVLINADTGRLLQSKRFSYKEHTITIDAKGYVQATNRALVRLSQDLVRWLR